MWTIVFLVGIGITIWLMVNVKSAVPRNEVVLERLTPKQKVSVWVLSLVDPLIAGAIFYYGWKSKLPEKAKQANNISWLALGVLIAIAIIRGKLHLPPSRVAP